MTSRPPSPSRDLWLLVREEPLRHAASVVALLLGVGFAYLAPLAAARVIDAVAQASELAPSLEISDGVSGAVEGSARPWRGAAFVVLFTLAAGAFTYLKGRWSAGAAEATIRRLRERLKDHVQRLPEPTLARFETGDLVQRCTSDVETVRTFLSQEVVEIGNAVVLLAVAVPALLLLDAPTGLVALSLLPFVAGLALVFFGRIKDRFLAADEAEGLMTARLQESLVNVRVVQAFGREGHETERFGRCNAEFRDLTFGLFRVLSVYWATSDLFCLTQFALVLFVGATRIQAGALTVGELFAFVAWVNLFIWPVRHAGRTLSMAGKALVSLRRLLEVLEEPLERDPEHPLPPAEPARGAVELDRVAFSHDAGRPVLRDVSFVVAPGETVALVGAPGSGKTTIVHLLARLLEPDSGRLCIDGVDVARMRRADVRRLVALVAQEPFLHSRSVAQLLRLGDAGASHEDLVHAARAARVHDDVERLPRGYDTLVGERGVTLSGGQRQRLSIARALLRDAPVLVLDDALSAVDARTEAGIRSALLERRGRRTTIVIAHRPSTVREADRILVMEDGRVAQSGTHAELLAADGPYARTWALHERQEGELSIDDGRITAERGA